MKRKEREGNVYDKGVIGERLAILNEMKGKLETFDANKLEFGTNPITELSPTEELKPFYALIGALLSTKTGETLRLKIMNNLIEHYKILTPKDISKASEDIILELLDGCYGKQRKAKYIIECSKKIHLELDDNVPNTIEELKKLPGIGQKMANIICYSGYGKIQAINVDERSLLLLQRIGWIKKSVKSDEKARIQIEQWLPKEHWDYFPRVTILFAKLVCKPKKPLCDQCPLAKKQLCKYYCKLKEIPLKTSAKPNQKGCKMKKIDIEEADNVILSGVEEETEFLSNLDLVELSKEHKKKEQK